MNPHEGRRAFRIVDGTAEEHADRARDAPCWVCIMRFGSKGCRVHRIRTNVAPNPRLNLTLDLFFLRANLLNNRGGNPALAQLQSRDLGREVQFVTRWAISRNVYFVGVASHAIPGRAIRLATPDPARPWSSLQAQFYFNL